MKSAVSGHEAAATAYCMCCPAAAVCWAPHLEHIHHVGVGTEEDVKACLIPVTILILPGSNLQQRNRGIVKSVQGTVCTIASHTATQAGYCTNEAEALLVLAASCRLPRQLLKRSTATKCKQPLGCIKSFTGTATQQVATAGAAILPVLLLSTSQC